MKIIVKLGANTWQFRTLIAGVIFLLKPSIVLQPMTAFFDLVVWNLIGSGKMLSMKAQFNFGTGMTE